MILTMGLCLVIHARMSNEDEQESTTFNHPVNRQLASILILAILTLFIPGYFEFAKLGSKEGILHLSRWESILLSIAGILFCIFLTRNWHQFNIGSGYEERSKLSLKSSIFLLLLVLLLICFESFAIAHVIKPVSISWGLSDTFIGTVILPIVTQSSTHISHIRHTLSDSLPVVIARVFSDCINLAIYVAPVFVLFSWVVPAIPTVSEEKLAMGLNFGFFQIIITILSVIFMKFVSMEGHVVWYTGVFMVIVYITLGIAFFYHP